MSVDLKSAAKPVILVDGSGYIFRAYYAVRHLSTRDGLPTNAVFGFVNMLLKLLRQFEPAHLAMVFDTKAPTFRHKMYAEYKAHRPPPPEDLIPQFALIRRAVEALAMPQFRMEGYEADDLLGALARQAAEAGHNVLICTGDKDLMQLVNEKVRLYDGMKDKFFGRDEVIERFGVSPEHIIDVLALAGDSSDNVPGVRGIGEKTAAKLVQEYGDLESILAAASSIKQNARRQRLLDGQEMARLSRRLVTIDRFAPVKFDLQQLRYVGPDAEACRALFTELEFTRLLKDLPRPKNNQDVPSEAPESTADAKNGDEKKFAAAAKPPRSQPLTGAKVQAPNLFSIHVDRSRYRAVTTEKDLRGVISQCREAKTFALDTETDNLDALRARLVGVSLSWAEGEAVYIPCAHQVELIEQQLSMTQLQAGLNPLLADPELCIVAQNGKYDRKVLLSNGFVDFTVCDDPMLASYLLDADENSHGLDALSQRHLDHQPISYKEICGTGRKAITFDQLSLDVATPYAAEDADLTLRLNNVFKSRLLKDKQQQLYRELEMPLEHMLANMERHGVLVDVDKLAEQGAEMQEEMQGIAERCFALAGHSFNLASPKQVAAVLFDELDLPMVKKTKTGASTNAAVLEELSTLHDLPKTLLEHRQLAKLKNTYVDVLPRLVHPETGRVHTRYNQAVAATGRLSSSDPNLQNIPIRSPQGRRIRQAFVAPAGRLIISADYSQIELRVLAHVSQDPDFIQAFVDGQDIHARTASEIFALPIDQVSSEQRRSAKAINFGLMYGMGAFRLARELSISNKEAQQYIDAYFARYVGIRAWHEKTLQQARMDGYVQTLDGRRRRLRDLNSSNHHVRSQAERMAINTPIQGSAADIIKKAMLSAETLLAQQVPSAKIILQVHDELVIEVDSNEADKAKLHLREAMQASADLRVPLIVDVGQGLNWDEAH